jgi:hypothetical protein
MQVRLRFFRIQLAWNRCPATQTDYNKLNDTKTVFSYTIRDCAEFIDLKLRV